MTAPHRIRTLRLDVRTPHAETAFRLRQGAAERVKSVEFARALERVFDEVVSPEVTCQIERLEVAVGTLTGTEFEEQWLARCLSALETALRQAVKKEGVGEFRTVNRTEAETTREAFLEFLATGNVPWWATVPDWAVWEQAILGVVRENRAAVSTELAFILAQPDAARRLVWQFTPGFVWRLVGFLAGKNAHARLTQREAALRVAWQRVGYPLRAIREKLESNRMATVQALAGQNWVADEALFDVETPEAWKKSEAEKGGSEPPERFFSPEQARPPRSAEPTAEPMTSSKPPEPASRELPEPNEPATSAQKRPAIFPEKRPWFVQNAGVVLLHPFLAPLFDELGFLENGTFRSEAARHRAVHLLGHLVGQPLSSPETDLTLPKILVGLAPHESIRRRVRLTRAEKSEARNLLLAVLGHWTALKNTSPEALQSEFLRREGRLDHRDDAWHLTVEHRTADVLLSRLPWGISLVKLPWMPDFLHVTWV